MADPIVDTRLSTRLRDETQSLHRVAERSGVMRELLQGRLGLRSYCVLLRNLHAIYAALEGEMDRHASSSLVGSIRMRDLYRAASLRNDLDLLHGPNWKALAVVEATHDYVARLESLSGRAPSLLAAHAYVRYMGDLSGGQLLRGIVQHAYAQGSKDGTAFYRFPSHIDPESTKDDFRSALDALPLDEIDMRAMIDEGKSAFERHVRLFDELALVARDDGTDRTGPAYKPSPP